MTKPFSLFFDEDFDNIVKSLMDGSGGRYVNNSSFPPADVIINEDKSLIFYFALAGYKKENIDVSFSGDALVIKTTPATRKMKEGSKYINRGIKNSKSVNKYYVPFQKYDTENTKAVFEDGILKIEIPSSDIEKARVIKIK